MDAARQELEDAQNHICFLGSGSEQSCSNRTPCSYTIDRVDVCRVPYTAYTRLVRVFHEGLSPSPPGRECSVRKCTAPVRARNKRDFSYTHVRYCERSETSAVDVVYY